MRTIVALLALVTLTACATTNTVNHVELRRQGIIDVPAPAATTVNDVLKMCLSNSDDCYRYVFGLGYTLAARRGQPSGFSGECVSVPMEASYFRSAFLKEFNDVRNQGNGRAGAAVVVQSFVEETYPCALKHESDSDPVVDVSLTVAQFNETCANDDLRCESTFYYVAGKLFDAPVANSALYFRLMQNFCPSREGPIDLKGLFMRLKGSFQWRAKEWLGYKNKTLIEAIVSDALFTHRCYLYEPPVLVDDALELFSTGT